jgi:SAM-dependent methyltransferase
VPADIVAFVRAALPPPPARVLELGAGAGHLAATLSDAGYDVLAIDPASQTEAVVRVAIADVDAPAASFDAAVAVVSMHHVEPLGDSCRRLAELLRPGGRLVIDEFDVGAFDERAARWLKAERADVCGHEKDPAAMVAELRGHLHTVARLGEALEPYFRLGEPVRGAYLYRWSAPSALREAEEEEIAAGRLPATGARLIGTRR